MKALIRSLLWCGLAAGLLALPVLWAADEPAQDPAPPEGRPGAAERQPDTPPPAEPAESGEKPPAMDETPAPPDDAPPANPEAAPPSANPPAQPTPAAAPANGTQPPGDEPAPADATATSPVAVVADGERGLRLNFRGAPLELVLNYLSEAAGFIIVPEADVRGKVDVWSSQPLTKDEAVEVLNTVLNKNGYAVLRSGRTLRVVTKEEAKKRDLPVKTGSDPAGIPKNEEMVTQIIPVRFVNAVQLSRDLSPLMPPQATVVANEGGNAIVITDTQINIRRMSEIIKALDTSIASVSTVKVFPLQYADARALATVIQSLFQGTDSSSRSGAGAGMNPMQQSFRGFGGPGGMAGGMSGRGGGNTGGSGSGSSRVATPRVVAVADERSNAVVVSAPEEQMTVIVELVAQVDTPVEDITELRVFRLKFADPQETADLLASLFPDTTSSSQTGRGMVRFGGPGGMMMGGGRGSTTGDSSRQLKQGRVLAVADMRTGSVVVSAAHDLMEQIGKMIEQLDSDPAKKQKVFVFPVENNDVTVVEEVLRGLFETQNSRNTRSTSRTTSNNRAGNQLNNRATQRQNQGSSGNTGFGGSSSRSSGLGSAFGQ